MEMVWFSSKLNQVWVPALGIIVLCASIANAQTRNICISDQPLPELPVNYGLLDAQTTVLLRVDFNADGIPELAISHGEFMASFEEYSRK
jgi:hypothetical protein